MKGSYNQLDSSNNPDSQQIKKGFNLTSKYASGALNNSKVIRSPRLVKKPQNSAKKAIIKSPAPKTRYSNKDDNLTTYQRLLKKQTSIGTVDLSQHIKKENMLQDVNCSSELSHCGPNQQRNKQDRRY